MQIINNQDLNIWISINLAGNKKRPKFRSERRRKDKKDTITVDGKEPVVQKVVTKMAPIWTKANKNIFWKPIFLKFNLLCLNR